MPDICYKLHQIHSYNSTLQWTATEQPGNKYTQSRYWSGTRAHNTNTQSEHYYRKCEHLG